MHITKAKAATDAQIRGERTSRPAIVSWDYRLARHRQQIEVAKGSAPDKRRSTISVGSGKTGAISKYSIQV